jgi:hypothetical protein
MPQGKLMTLHEELRLGALAYELEDQGRMEEAAELRKQIPIEAYLLKFYKDHLGVEALLKTGWNMSKAEAEYGPDWLSK